MCPGPVTCAFITFTVMVKCIGDGKGEAMGLRVFHMILKLPWGLWPLLPLVLTPMVE